ncbi:MAG: HesA/MoeB/ThiF family protein [Deltaproteobacteria bacterium]|jgi:molybdopterin/thiamine biosynthesis adenylyltransferase|nr:HesA/MoeB/ThiF family protein [Deltaproteobacteria bacterium]
MAFNAEQLARYSRQIILKELGIKGQQKLKQARVLVVGAGGLGSPAAFYLAAAGVGHIGIIDADEVDLSNLQRQILHGTDDVGRPKADSARASLLALNPETEVRALRAFVDAGNIMGFIRDYDFIIDGTDNFPAKFLINDACVLAGKAFSHAGILRFTGQLMTYVPGQGPCYRCVFREPPPPEAVPSCRQAGVIGALAGVVGSLQAMEAVKYIVGAGALLTGALLTYNGLQGDFRKIALSRRADCDVCGEHPSITAPVDYAQAVCDA